MKFDPKATLTFHSRDFPQHFERDVRGAPTGPSYLKNEVRDWLIKETPGAWLRGQNIGCGEACIQFKTQEDAVKFKMFML